MPRVAIVASIFAAVCVLLAACSPTRHTSVVGPGGQRNTRIHCRTRTPHKCTLRAQEVCGTYSIVEPLHLDPEDAIESTMVVHCNPSTVPPAYAPPNQGAAATSAPPLATPLADGGA
jgi:hypothetical protein